MGARPRPNPLQWLWYSYGGSLPARLNDWVLHDCTCGTWVLRQFVRSIVQLALPIAIVMMFPGSVGMKLFVIGAAGLPAILFQMGYIVPAMEHRMLKAGFEPGIAEKIRSERSQSAQIEGNRRRRERAEARRAARLS